MLPSSCLECYRSVHLQGTSLPLGSVLTRRGSAESAPCWPSPSFLKKIFFINFHRAINVLRKQERHARKGRTACWERVKGIVGRGEWPAGNR